MICSKNDDYGPDFTDKCSEQRLLSVNSRHNGQKFWLNCVSSASFKKIVFFTHENWRNAGQSQSRIDCLRSAFRLIQEESWNFPSASLTLLHRQITKLFLKTKSASSKIMRFDFLGETIRLRKVSTATLPSSSVSIRKVVNGGVVVTFFTQPKRIESPGQLCGETVAHNDKVLEISHK